MERLSLSFFFGQEAFLIPTPKVPRSRILGGLGVGRDGRLCWNMVTFVKIANNYVKNASFGNKNDNLSVAIDLFL